MTPGIAFLVGITITMGAVFLALLYLRSPLQAVLTDLCGTAERARFWTTFTNLTLFLVPLGLALDHRPTPGIAQATVFAIGDQIESAVIGLVIAVVILGMVLSWFIAPNRGIQNSKDLNPGHNATQTSA